MLGTRRRKQATACRVEDPDVVREAQRILILAKWRILEEAAASRLAGSFGVLTTRLVPDSRVILVVAVDGQVVGQVRRRHRRWVAVVPGALGPAPRFYTRRAAVDELRRTAQVGE